MSVELKTIHLPSQGSNQQLLGPARVQAKVRQGRQGVNVALRPEAEEVDLTKAEK